MDELFRINDEINTDGIFSTVNNELILLNDEYAYPLRHKDCSTHVRHPSAFGLKGFVTTKGICFNCKKELSSQSKTIIALWTFKNHKYFMSPAHSFPCRHANFI